MPPPARSELLADEDLRTCVGVLRILEDKRMTMHADEYREAAASLLRGLRTLGIDDLLAVAAGRMAVLSTLAENVLFERGACLTFGDREARARALLVAEELFARV